MSHVNLDHNHTVGKVGINLIVNMVGLCLGCICLVGDIQLLAMAKETQQFSKGRSKSHATNESEQETLTATFKLQLWKSCYFERPY